MPALGGCIHDCFSVSIGANRRFLKTNDARYLDAFAAETEKARGKPVSRANAALVLLGRGSADREFYEAVLKRGAMPTFVPRRTAKLYCTANPPAWRATRNAILQQIEAQGRSTWRVRSGCTRQSIAENTMFRFKALFGGRL